MSILGTRVVRLEDPRFLRGEGTYIANLDLPGALHITYVRSTLAHGRVVSVDASAAAEMPGVVAVFTGADVDLSPVVPEPRLLNKDMVQPFVATDTVRFVGEVVAVVVSETASQGADAAAMVEVDYDPLPNVLDPGDALAGTTLLHDAAGTNIALTFAANDDDDIFASCEVVVELDLVNQKVATAPLEVRSCAARWDGDSLTQWACSQGAHGARDGLAKAFGVDPAQVRVVTPDVGG
jgi:carbon-monoxide dehydrogenase large subunit